jgi:hypothetical protein
MNLSPSSNNDTTADVIPKNSEALSEEREPSFLEMMDSIPGGIDIEFEPPILNIIFKPAEFD